MTQIYEQLCSIVGQHGVLRDEPMSRHTTFRVGGPVEFLVNAATPEEVRNVISLCVAEGVDWRILGHGSNVLVADEGLRGVALCLSGGMAEVDVNEDGLVVAGAGISNARVAAAAQRAGLAGYEFAAGIPGTVGGAAIMNAGAYDGEFRQVALSVSGIEPDGAIREFAADEACWGYRHSALMDKGIIVLSASLQLRRDDPDAIKERMADLARRRQEKQPLDLPSAGSTFKRPPGQFAGKLIQDAGMQGFTVGGAQVSTKHAGFVVNAGDATAADVLAVIRAVQERVRVEFGVNLECEVRLWGFPE